MDLSCEGVKNEISYLHNIIQEKYISIPLNRCSIPLELKRKIVKGDYSQTIIQEVSDLIGTYLNIHESVKIEVVHEKIKHAPATLDSPSDPEKAGMFSVEYSYGNRLIKL